MSEEKIIEEFKELIYNPDYDEILLCTEDGFTGWHELFKNVLDLYQKEKEKNKELENADLTTVYMNGFYDGEKKWKDKIKKRAIEYENNNEGYDCTTADYKQSQNIGKYLAYIELLEERN